MASDTKTAELAEKLADLYLLPLPKRMPGSVHKHQALGDLYDRLALQTYAVGYAQDCIKALLRASEGRVPEGFALVPRRASQEMIQAGALQLRTYLRHNDGYSPAECWAHMLAAAPSAPVLAEPAKFVRMVDGVPCITVAEHKHLMAQRPVQGGGDALELLERVVAEARTLGHVTAKGNDTTSVRRCLEEAVSKLRAALPPAQPAPQAQGVEQHSRDSVELRSVCQARDDARRERDLCRVEVAGLSSSVGHLSALVDDQTRLVQKAVGIMKALHESATPDNGPEMNAIIPADAFHRFVDGHAEVLHALASGPQITTPPSPVAHPEALPVQGDDWITDVLRAVAELPDRNSPADQPEMMLVSADELRDILSENASARASLPTSGVPRHVECRECADCGHAGINDDGPNAACNTCGWSGPSPKEDKCPECHRIGTMTSACPKCAGRYSLVAETDLAAPQPAAARVFTPAERDALIDAKLAEYNYPANSANAGRAGWYAYAAAHGIASPQEDGGDHAPA